MAEVVSVWAYTLDERMTAATTVERVKRGIVLKSGGLFDGSKKRRDRRKGKRALRGDEGAGPILFGERALGKPSFSHGPLL